MLKSYKNLRNNINSQKARTCASTGFFLAFFTFFYSSVTDESFVDETRVWRKYKISILVSMMSLFTMHASPVTQTICWNKTEEQQFYCNY